MEEKHYELDITVRSDRRSEIHCRNRRMRIPGAHHRRNLVEYRTRIPIDGVKRWIVYPEGEEPNDLIAPEMLLKYVCRECKQLKEIAKEESEKVKQLRKLNKELTEQFNKLHQKHMNLQADIQNRCSATEDEVEALRQENKKLKGILECLGHVYEAIKNNNQL